MGDRRPEHQRSNKNWRLKKNAEATWLTKEKIEKKNNQKKSNDAL